MTGYKVQVTKALNGEIAVQKFINNNYPGSKTGFELIILDCEMPVLDGYTAA
jgi:CheY-like chemotaxis protein